MQAVHANAAKEMYHMQTHFTYLFFSLLGHHISQSLQTLLNTLVSLYLILSTKHNIPVASSKTNGFSQSILYDGERLTSQGPSLKQPCKRLTSLTNRPADHLRLHAQRTENHVPSLAMLRRRATRRPTTPPPHPNPSHPMPIPFCLTDNAASQVDYKKLARLCEMSNPVSASNAWSKIKKKLAAQAAENGLDGGGSDHGTPKPKGTMTMKRKKGGDVDGDADDEEVGTPSKKVRGGKGKVDEKFEDFEGQVNGTPVKVEDVEEEEEIVFS